VVLRGEVVLIKYQYGAVYCDRCDKTYYYRSEILESYVSYEIIRCPDCWSYLRQIRADLGHSVLGSTLGGQGDFSLEIGDNTYIDNVDKLFSVMAALGL
jgi:hypothetical protein